MKIDLKSTLGLFLLTAISVVNPLGFIGDCILVAALTVIAKVIEDNWPKRRCYAVVMSNWNGFTYFRGDGFYSCFSDTHIYTRREASLLLMAVDRHSLGYVFVHKKGRPLNDIDNSTK